MRILYLSGSYVPSRRASSVHVMRMCEAIAALGHQVTLATKENPNITEPGVADDYAYYGVEPTFKIEKLRRPNYKGGGLVNAYAIWRFLRRHKKQIDVVYARDIPAAWVAKLSALPIIFEAHGVPPRGIPRYQFRQIVSSPDFLRLVVISQGLKKDLAARNLLPHSKKLIIAHDGAVPLRESGAASPHQFQNEKFALGYIGQLFPGKGMEVILPLAQRLPDVSFHVIGGQQKDLQYWQAKDPPDNVQFHGFVSPGEVSALYSQFDALLLPPQNEVYGASGQSDISRWMSPLKMFEYMATGKPIISSDLPVLREVLADGVNALLVPPDDVAAWESAVRQLQSNPGLGQRIGRQACQDFQENYTWTARAKKVLQGL